MTVRGVALGMGIAFATLTGLELLVGEAAFGDATLLMRTTKANILHWSTALAMLGAFFAMSAARLLVMRVAGGLLLLVAVWGVFAADGLGSFLGFADGIPAAYNAYHGMAGVLSLSVSFLSRAGDA